MNPACPPDMFPGNSGNSSIPNDWPPTTKWPPRIPDPQHVDGPPGHTEQHNDDLWARARYDAANTNGKAPEHPLITLAESHVETYIPALDAHQYR